MVKIGLIQHGCPKNLIDSELMLGILVKNGFEITLDEDACDIALVNTCSFIHDAEAESVQSILRLGEKKKQIIVAGCLAQKHGRELLEVMPEISALIGTGDFDKVAEAVNNLLSGVNSVFISE